VTRDREERLERIRRETQAQRLGLRYARHEKTRAWVDRQRRPVLADSAPVLYAWEREAAERAARDGRVVRRYGEVLRVR
jgi:hypothetical protein